ncbi:MAG: M16 family metallopeptidase [Phycisphaerae bacterium]
MHRFTRVLVALSIAPLTLTLAAGTALGMDDKAPAAAAAHTPGAWASNPVTSVEGITEYRLPNGLRVLLFPDASSANVTVNITYFVGSRHEGRGEKGMAHLLEHMVFKGTPTHDDVWKLLQEHGAQFNGTTWLDRTNYYETLVANDKNLEFALRLEADRMMNSNIKEEDLRSEMTVVRNEFEMGENNPMQIMMKNLAAKAYTWHPYGNSTIGNRADIERVPASNLKKFYQQYYRPDNAMLVVAGKFEPATALSMVDKYFAGLKGPNIPMSETYTDEPVQDGPRFFEVRREGSQASIGFFYHTPAGGHEDAVAVELLADVLGNRPSGRLYKALVEGGYAASVSVFPIGAKERGSLFAIATLKSGQDPKKAHEVAQSVLESLAANPITDEEVERARTSWISSFKVAMADSNRIGVDLTDYAATGDWRLMFLNRDRAKAATTADVQRVAQAYLIENNRTSGMFIPTSGAARAIIPAAPDVNSLVKDYQSTEQTAQGEAFDATPKGIEARVKRSQPMPNVELALLPKENRGDAVSVSMTIRFGDEKSLLGKRVQASTLGGLMRRGAGNMSYQQISDEIEKLQSVVGIASQQGVLNVNITSDRANLGKVLALVKTMLREPTFPLAEFDTMIKERIAGIEAGLTNPQALGPNAMQRASAPFPKDSYFYVPTLEEQIADIRATTLDSVKAYYNNLVGPAKVEVAVVGDFDESEATAKIGDIFTGWQPKGEYKRVARPYLKNLRGSETVATPDKPMAMVMMASVLEMDDKDSDAVALNFANYVLGGNANSRLLDRLRQRDGLSYGAGSFFTVSSLDKVAPLGGYAICAAPNAEKALAAMKEEFTKWIDAGITQEELDKGKEAYKLDYLTSLSDDGNVAGTLASYLFLDRTMMWDQEDLDKTAALTVDQVNDAIKRRMKSAEFRAIIAGDVRKE